MRPRRHSEEGVWLHPVDEIEPEVDTLSEAAEMLSAFLRAVAEQKTCCGAGNEALAHVAKAMPKQFPGGFSEPETSIDGDYIAMGRAFSRLFACIAGGFHRTRVSEAGVRAIAAVYVLRPDLLGGDTMDSIGARCGGITRQAVSKHARSIRDAHGGIHSRVMKSEETRLKCKITQLNR